MSCREYIVPDVPPLPSGADPTLTPFPVFRCKRCSKDDKYPQKFSKENYMIPCDVPAELEGMTFAEEMLISIILPEMVVCRLMKGGQRGYSGHAISFPRDLKHWVATELPRAACDLEVVVVRQNGRLGAFKDYYVRRQKVLCGLMWLKANNPHYRDVPINQCNLNALD
eukprot:GHVR01086607.1.p1 GENE.GHVR01086607.1~~GHVR01086607.1.p1  ORF type:complete len:190 (-),score=18.00 GHVR01086607.1:597-1100(-)